jgi:hypothetical protein
VLAEGLLLAHYRHANRCTAPRGTCICHFYDDLATIRRALAVPDVIPNREGTRLVRVTTPLLSEFVARTEDGRRVVAEWGEPDEFGIYEPVFTAHDAEGGR